MLFPHVNRSNGPLVSGLEFRENGSLRWYKARVAELTGREEFRDGGQFGQGSPMLDEIGIVSVVAVLHETLEIRTATIRAG